MKVRLFCLFIVAFALGLFLIPPAWSTEAPAQEATPAAAPEKPMEPAAQPAAPEQPMEPAATEKSMEQPALPTTPPAETMATTAIRIEEAVVSQDVVDRAPVGTGDVFAKETAKLYCFTRVVGAEADTEITHNWYYKGTLKASVKLSVRSNNWRTWSSKTIVPEWTGEWMVEILSDDGTPLESTIFFVQ